MSYSESTMVQKGKERLRKYPTLEETKKKKMYMVVQNG